MKNNKGITLVSLIMALIIVSILTSITVATSMNAYNQMKFEGAKAELEEVQKKVDEIAADYLTYVEEVKGTMLGTMYEDYFEARYNDSSFSNKLLSAHKDEVEKLLANHLEIVTDSTAAFYFTSEDLVKYFDLKGIDPVVVDFSYRSVYSVKGIRDPKNKQNIYYTASDWGANNQIYKSDSDEVERNLTASLIHYDDITNTFDVELKVHPKLDISIAEVYLNRNDNLIRINDFRDLSDENDNIIRITFEKDTIIDDTFVEDNSYAFRVVDSLKNNYDSSYYEFY